VYVCVYQERERKLLVVPVGDRSTVRKNSGRWIITGFRVGQILGFPVDGQSKSGVQQQSVQRPVWRLVIGSHVQCRQ
jgi:hypothetical protein